MNFFQSTRWYRIVTVVCSAVILANVGILVWQEIDRQRQMTEDRYVAFYTDEDRTYQVDADWQRYAGYQPVYDYNSHVYYDQLSETARGIYHMFEYALENRYTHILIDVRLLPEEIEPEQILHYLMLDSALVEQNLSKGEKVQETNLVYEGLIDRHQEIELHHLYVPGFSAEHFEKKMQALEKAREVAAGVPEGASDTETARYLYDYLGNHATYLQAENDGTRHYLYEALCGQQTNCDGFANAYSLLCQLAGLPCFEKIYWPEETDETGHTWTSVQLDGRWYNVDPTAAPQITGDDWTAPLRFRFGYSDRRQKYLPEYAASLPACESDLQPAALAFASPTDGDICDTLGALLNGSDEPVLFSLDSGDKTQIKSLMQSIVNTWNFSVSHVDYETHDGWVVYVKRTS